MESIGGLRNRTVAFLNAASEAQGQATPEGQVPMPMAEEPSVEEVEGDLA